MKSEARIIGFDDSPHTRADGRVPVIGVHMRGAGSVEGVLLTDVERDGGDSTNRIACCVADSGLRGIKAILLDGASFAGFNVVDLDGLHAETGIPCLAFTKGRPDLAAMRAALRNVPDPEGKWALLERRRIVEIRTSPAGHRPLGNELPIPTETATLSISFAGMDERVAIDLLALTTARGHTPEALRLAHMIAAIVR